MLELPRLAATVGIGLVSGLLSGMFGIGGGIVTTPAIRLLLNAPALIAVGTPLVAVLPSAMTGAASYARKGMADVRSGLTVGAAGSVAAVVGAALTRYVGGSLVLVLTAVVIVYVAVEMALQAFKPSETILPPAEETLPAAHSPSAENGRCRPARQPVGKLLVVGIVGGLYSGFLGLGGGLVLVPLMTRWLKMPIKCAIATSLTAIAVLSVPGIITHSVIGNVDWTLAMGLTIGVIPGAALGAHITLRASDRSVRIAFAALLLLIGLWLGLAELLAS